MLPFFVQCMLSVLLGGLLALPARSGTASPGNRNSDMQVKPVPGKLPLATATCPDFQEGMNSFSPNGVTRRVRLYLDLAAAKKLDGPLIFYWYGTTGLPSQVMEGLGVAGLNRVRALGGIVAAATHIKSTILPWISGPTAQEFALMDEVLACAIQKVGVDVRHIHAMGFSTGALLAAQAGYTRSGYLASVVSYSGGARNAGSQNPENLFPAMIFYGGASDHVLLNFQATSLQYAKGLIQTGHMVVLCNHARGHKLPTDAAPAALKFMLDHPFRQNPEPYLGGMPADFPPYCALQSGQWRAQQQEAQRTDKVGH